MKLPQNFEGVVNDAQHHNLYKKLIQQLNKDLLYANVDLSFDTEVLPTSLKVLLQDEVYRLLNQRFMDYLNLLYIVDVSEEKVKQLDRTDTQNLAEQVTFLILQREWQKVWFKNRYS